MPEINALNLKGDIGLKFSILFMNVFIYLFNFIILIKNNKMYLNNTYLNNNLLFLACLPAQKSGKNTHTAL